MRFTIRKKLIIVFFFMAFFLLVLAAFSIFNLKRLNTDMEKTLNDYQSALIDTSGIVSNVLFHSLKVEQYIATGNPAHLRAVEDLKANTVDYLADMQKKNLDPQEVQWVRRIAEAYQTYLALSSELLDYYKKRSKDKESIEGKQIRILALLENTLLADSMSLYQLKKLKTTALIEVHHRLYHNYLWITLLAGLFFVFLVILMGFSIIHSISTPINKLIATTKELAAGNLSARPPAQGGDEIGVLAEAFSAMADQLQNLFITLEKKVAERTRALSEEQEFVSAVLETTHALVVVFDPQGKIARFNKACREITGYAFPEVKNKPVWELLMRPEHAETYRTQVEKFKKDGLFDTHENYWITKKGTQRLISWFHTALRDHQGVIVHIVATGIDITERRKMEQEFFKIQKLESIGVLAGGIAHDFNNLLTSIHGEIELAQMNMAKGTKTYYNLAQALGSCNRARDLIWQFITISKGGAPNKKEGSLLAMIKETCEKALADSKIRYQVLQAEDLWSVAFDRSQMEQVIYNLVINAKEAMTDEGPVRIWLENVSIYEERSNYILEPGQYVRIVIQDEGRGIPEKHLPLLFDPYFSTKERGSQKGMGLGLTTAYSIIKKHDGHIDLASKVGMGTTFYIYLPANQKKS